MPRVKRGTNANKRRKKILKRTKGYITGRSKKYRAAKEAYLHAQRYAFRDRKKKKADFRQVWIIRLNAALKQYDLSYSRFIFALKKHKIELDRKVLADLAVNHTETFKKIVETVK